jgi:hypothetical protein
MKLTAEGTPEEVRQFLRLSGGTVGTTSAVRATETMGASKASLFSAQAQQYAVANSETLAKVQTMIGIHDNVFAAARFDRATMEQALHPDIKYFEFGKQVDPPGIEGASRRFAEFHKAFNFDKINNNVTFGDGEYLANVYEVEATHTGEYAGVAATNQKVRINGIGVLRIQDGVVTEYYDAYDTVNIVPQVARTSASRSRSRRRK